jgi:enolase
MQKTRMQRVIRKDGKVLWAPWQFRNSGMGGRHTEREYPESNISMQETMFVPLSASNYEDAQEMTVKLQNRLKEIIENAEGCRVMGVGLEGGLAAYITKGQQELVPEQRLWRMARQAIIESGYHPGKDVALALDAAAAELEQAYREEYEQPDVVGMYLFWRDEEKTVMSTDELFELYRRIIQEDDIPIVSIEDSFGEDQRGWALITEKLGDKIFIVADDLVTTKDSSIEYAADHNLSNTLLCKANQIGTLSETLLAILVALGKGLNIVVSHRSKSPNDDMEAQLGLASFAMGIKAGGGANTERLVKYGSIMRVLAEVVREAARQIQGTDLKDSSSERFAEDLVNRLEITNTFAWEEATNAGIPTVGVQVSFGIKGSERFKNFLVFSGATPLGTSAGTDEAVHLVDSVIHRSQIPQEEYLPLFDQSRDGSYRFRREVTRDLIEQYGDTLLSQLYRRAQRYDGKGCLNAVENVNTILAKAFEGKTMSDLLSLVNIDRELLKLERDFALQRGLLTADSSKDKEIEIMQRKGNLGMNAILSQSLALARLTSVLQGKQLWEVLRETIVETMAKTIVANGGLKLIPEEIAQRVCREEKRPLWERLAEELTFEELEAGLRAVNRHKSADCKLYELLRKELPLYTSQLEMFP